MKTIKLTLTFVLVFNLISFCQQQELLYGVAYYHEYMPTNRLDEDVKLIKDAGFNVVRLAESSWALFEPQEGVFKFSWMDTIVDKFYASGIKVIIGTPTYSIPVWMAKKHPEIMAQHKWGGQFEFGGRCRHDITNQHYIFYAQRIVQKITQQYANHPAVIGFQIDNESKTNFLASEPYYDGLKEYVKQKYKTIENLNKAWGLNYWSQTLTSWDELPSVKGTVFSNYKLDLERYNHATITQFLKWQSDIVSKYKRSNQFITHNFDGTGPNAQVRADKISPYLDVIGADIYHDWQNEFSGFEISYTGDYIRTLKNKNYLVIETNAQTTTIGANKQYPPYPNQLRLAYYAHLASGAEMVEYWHWHSTHSGAEVYWRGLLSQDLKPNRLYKEASVIAKERAKLNTVLYGLKINNKVGVFYHHDAHFGIENESFSGEVNYQNHLKNICMNFYKANIGIDVITEKTPHFDDYELIVVPMLYVASDSLLKSFLDLAQKGVHVVFTAKSGFENEYGTVRHTSQPGIISDVLGCTYQEFTNLKSSLLLSSDKLKTGTEFTCNNWAELLMPTTADVLYSYTGDFLKPYAAVVHKPCGKGSITYMGTIPSSEVFQETIQYLSKRYKKTGFESNVQADGLVIKKAINQKGKVVHFYLNFSKEAREIKYAYKKGNSLLDDTNIGNGQSINIEPWGVKLIVEE